MHFARVLHSFGFDLRGLFNAIVPRFRVPNARVLMQNEPDLYEF
jgi:hypothetical protein